VLHSFNFLAQIPWTEEFRGIPEIARAHHEKLNGKGYPFGLHANQIPIQAKMMTICDIYDALSASDRPYKRAIPTDRALDILKLCVRDEEIDPSCSAFFWMPGLSTGWQVVLVFSLNQISARLMQHGFHRHEVLHYNSTHGLARIRSIKRIPGSPRSCRTALFVCRGTAEDRARIRRACCFRDKRTKLCGSSEDSRNTLNRANPRKAMGGIVVENLMPMKACCINLAEIWLREKTRTTCQPVDKPGIQKTRNSSGRSPHRAQQSFRMSSARSVGIARL